MDLSTLNEALLARTDHKDGLREVVEAYSRAVEDTARVLEVSVASSEISGDSGGISLRLVDQPALAVGWTPATGWCWHTDAGRIYRVTSEADAAGIVPSPETAAAWLRVVAGGDRSGHTHPPEELAAEDEALLDLSTARRPCCAELPPQWLSRRPTGSTRSAASPPPASPGDVTSSIPAAQDPTKPLSHKACRGPAGRKTRFQGSVISASRAGLQDGAGHPGQQPVRDDQGNAFLTGPLDQLRRRPQQPCSRRS